MAVLSGDGTAIVGKAVNHRDTGYGTDTVTLRRKKLGEKYKNSVPAHTVTVELP